MDGVRWLLASLQPLCHLYHLYHLLQIAAIWMLNPRSLASLTTICRDASSFRLGWEMVLGNREAGNRLLETLCTRSIERNGDNRRGKGSGEWKGIVEWCRAKEGKVEKLFEEGKKKRNKNGKGKGNEREELKKKGRERERKKTNKVLKGNWKRIRVFVSEMV